MGLSILVGIMQSHLIQQHWHQAPMLDSEGAFREGSRHVKRDTLAGIKEVWDERQAEALSAGLRCSAKMMKYLIV